MHGTTVPTSMLLENTPPHPQNAITIAQTPQRPPSDQTNLSAPKSAPLASHTQGARMRIGTTHTQTTGSGSARPFGAAARLCGGRRTESASERERAPEPDRGPAHSSVIAALHCTSLHTSPRFVECHPHRIAASHCCRQAPLSNPSPEIPFRDLLHTHTHSDTQRVQRVSSRHASACTAPVTRRLGVSSALRSSIF